MRVCYRKHAAFWHRSSNISLFLLLFFCFLFYQMVPWYLKKLQPKPQPNVLRAPDKLSVADQLDYFMHLAARTASPGDHIERILTNSSIEQEDELDDYDFIRLKNASDDINFDSSQRLTKLQAINYRKRNSSEKFAIFTLLTRQDFIPGAQILAYSLRKWVSSDSGVDLIAMAMKEANFLNFELEGLAASGWTVKEVPRIGPPRATNNRYEDMFTKLWLWNQTEYTRILYLDSDIIPVRPVLSLFNLNVSFGAARDWGTDSPLGLGVSYNHRFNAGVLLLKPNNAEFKRLMDLKTQNLVHYVASWSEQGFLNEVYRDMWFEISATYNLYTYTYRENRKLWDSYYPFVKLIHATDSKPFLTDGIEQGFSNEITKLYHQKMDEMTVLWGFQFSILTFIDCSKKDLQFLRNFVQPIAIIDFCSTRKNSFQPVTTKKLKIFRFSPDSCRWKDRLTQIWDSTGNLKTYFTNSENFILEYCKVDILRQFGMANPFLTYFVFWTEFQNLKSADLFHEMRKWHKSMAKLLPKPHAIDLQTARLQTSSSSGANSSCDLLGLGGTRKGVEDFSSFFFESLEFMGGWFNRTKSPTALDLARCVITGGGGKIKATSQKDLNDHRLHLFRSVNDKHEYASLELTFQCFQNFCN